MKRVLFLFFLLLGCQEKGKLGSRSNPVKLYFTPSVDAETIATNSKKFIQYLENATGLYFETGIPTNYIAVVEAFGSDRADIAVMNSFGYLMANEKYGASAKLSTLRYGKNYYRGQIIANVKSGIKELKDINDKKFAFTDSSSTSGHLFPLKMLKDGKIRDARERVKTQFPDVEEKVKIIAITEKIPNDPFVFRKGLPKEITDKFIKALKDYLSTEEGIEAFKSIYSVEGVMDSNDSAYDGLRDMVKSVNLDKEKLLK